MQESYEGPFVLLTPSVTSSSCYECLPVSGGDAQSANTSSLTTAAAAAGDGYVIDSGVSIEGIDIADSAQITQDTLNAVEQQGVQQEGGPPCFNGIRIVSVTEDSVKQQFYPVTSLPPKQTHLNL